VGGVSSGHISVTPIINQLLVLYDLQIKNGDINGADATMQYALHYLDRQMGSLC